MKNSKEKYLEKLLKQSTDEPAHRPEFYTALLESTIYIIGDTEKDSIEEADTVNLEAGSKINVHNWKMQDGSPVIPFFSSLEVLQESIDSELSYLALPSKSLFEMTLGTTLFLNPKSDYGKEFTPYEVEQLLNDGLNQKPIQRLIEKETEILIGQPENYPIEMVDSLIKLLTKHKNVERAYLALMQDASVDEKPHLIIGIEAHGEIEKIISEVGNVAADSASDNEAVDIFRIKSNESGLSQYFNESVKPFYEKSLGRKLRSFFGFGNA